MRRFAGSQLNMTQQLKKSVEKDHPDNIVAKVVDHAMHDGVLYLLVRWRGFTAEKDSFQDAAEILKSSPEDITEYFKRSGTVQDDDLTAFVRQHFPSLEHEDEVQRQRLFAGLRRERLDLLDVAADACPVAVPAPGRPYRCRPGP